MSPPTDGSVDRSDPDYVVCSDCEARAATSWSFCRNCEASLDDALPPGEADFVDDDLPAFDGADGCVKCGHKSATIDSIATTGDGLSRLFDLQNRSFEVVVCDRCGYTEFYRAPKRDDVILDLFFG